jgi:hypothetical protein
MREDIQIYRDTDAVSYSVLSALSAHPKNLVETETEEKKHYTFGTLVDCLMFMPEQYNEMFYESSIPKPGDKMGEWLDAYLKMDIQTDFVLNDLEDLILQAREEVGYDKRLSDEVALKKFNTVCLPFLDEVAQAGDKLIISPETRENAIAMESKLLNNEFTAPYFAQSSKDHETKFQLPLYYVLEELNFKSLPDIVLFDHAKKQIRIADLKTSGKPLLYFEKDFTDYKYYIQASLYHLGVSLSYPDYEVVGGFDFVVVNNFEEPMIWNVDQKHLTLGLLGGLTRFGRKIRGIYQLIEDYKWHVTNQKFDYPASVYASNGTKQIDIL